MNDTCEIRVRAGRIMEGWKALCDCCIGIYGCDKVTELNACDV